MAATYQDCIDACHACADACEYCVSNCLAEESPRSLARCASLARDCADMCRLAAAFMARGSTRIRSASLETIDMCDACGDECDRHTTDYCRLCAAACRRCAEECRRMTH